MRHNEAAIGLLNDILADRCQRCPLAVGNRLGRTSLVHLALAHLAAEPVRRDAGERIAAHIAVGGSRMGGRIPVMMIREYVVLINQETIATRTLRRRRCLQRS